MDEPLAGQAADHDFAADEVELDIRPHRDHAQRRQERRQQHRPHALRGGEQHFQRLANTSVLEMLGDDTLVLEKTVSAVCVAAEVLIPLGDLVDFHKEAQRAQKDYENMSREIARSEAKLNSQGFLAKAPEALILQERQKLEENKVMLESFRKRMDEFNG